MRLRRRDFLAAGAMTASAMNAGLAFAQRGGDMYGLIGKMTVAPGRRDELISILLEGAATMPGCLSYIIAKDTIDANAISLGAWWWLADTGKLTLSGDLTLFHQEIGDRVSPVAIAEKHGRLGETCQKNVRSSEPLMPRRIRRRPCSQRRAARDSASSPRWRRSARS